MTMYCVVHSTNISDNGEPEVESVHGIFTFLKSAVKYANEQLKDYSTREDWVSEDWEATEATEENLESNMSSPQGEFFNWKIFAVKGN